MTVFINILGILTVLLYVIWGRTLVMVYSLRSRKNNDLQIANSRLTNNVLKTNVAISMTKNEVDKKNYKKSYDLFHKDVNEWKG
ncbi:hypothetical protein F963_03680 [Acinetobacter bereziniae NIPH 3]|uniref:Uncharacterized protein n=1 Tax=Acinetobacter bereziniae NIPH 3 TaxID=1217651 RepID=N8YMB6_ACIBZ|nr:hypothetical protein F963_03680 [Acinetobacter bereziniae NIPH 3]